MSYKESHQRASDLATQALEQMEQLEIAPHPDNYELWYAYNAEIDANLSHQLAMLLENAGAFDPQNYEKLKGSFLSKETSELLQATSESVDSAIATALTTIDAASSNTREYSDKLAGFSGDLETADADQVRTLVADAVADAQQAMARNSELEAQLKGASERIEELRDSLEDARRASETDGLTGLPNRRAFDLGLEAEVERARADRTPLTLLIADVDHFKAFNDNFGHRVGDEVLKVVARVMKSLLKGRDKPARYGGEEFCVILPTTDLEGAMSVAEQIRQTIGAKALKSARTGKSYGQITISLGCASLTPQDSIGSLIERADAALYFAKNNGRNQVASEKEVAQARKAS